MFSPLFTWVPFTGLKGIFLHFPVRSLKKQNHFIVANLTLVVLLAEDCCANSMKLRVQKN